MRAQPGRSEKRYRLRVAAIFAGVIAVSIYLFFAYFRGLYSPPPLIFAGDSSRLERTIIVPTLDTQFPSGKNAIWCGSFQLAWNMVRDTIVKEPVRLSNAQAIADQLNASPFTTNDLSPDTYYATAGVPSSESVKSIKTDVRDRFPRLSTSIENLHAAPDGLLAFAAIEVTSQFTMPYLQNHTPLEFTDSSGKTTNLTSFGVLSKYDGRSSIELRKQPAVLFSHAPSDDPGTTYVPGAFELDEFILDLCKDSDSQILIAMVPRKDSLAAILEYIAEQMVAFQKSDDYQYKSTMQGLDTLMVPDMNWQISHRFRELEGKDKRIENSNGKGYWLQEAFQDISFTLDRSGARVASTSWARYAAAPRRFAVSKPFLIALRERKSQNPFFVMWVDNAELLNPD